MAVNPAQAIVQHLLEAPIDSGDYPDYIHPEKKTKMAKRSHPLAKNAAYPKYTPQNAAGPQNWEELLASEQYQKTLERLAKYMADMDPRRRTPQGQPKSLRGTGINSIMGAMFQAISTSQEIEAAHKEELEQLAIQLVFEQPEFKKLLKPYQDGEFQIDAKLEQADLSKAVVSPETRSGAEEPEEEAPEAPEAPEAQAGGEERLDQEEAALKRMANFNPEVEKRKVINAMIQGAAVSKNYAYNLVSSELNAIDPRLLAFYGVAMAGSELGYFATPDAMAAIAVETPELAGGSAELDFGGEGGGKGVPIVRARGMIFPMLVQEITKGLMELMSYEGLPENPEEAQDVIDKADFVDHESWSMIMGRGLWTRFVNALGGNEDEITMHLYNRIAQLPVAQFNKVMQSIQGGGEGAKQTIKRLAQDVRMDMEAQDRDESGYTQPAEEAPPEYPEGKEPWR